MCIKQSQLLVCSVLKYLLSSVVEFLIKFLYNTFMNNHILTITLFVCLFCRKNLANNQTWTFPTYLYIACHYVAEILQSEVLTINLYIVYGMWYYDHHFNIVWYQVSNGNMITLRLTTASGQYPHGKCCTHLLLVLTELHLF